MSPKPKRKPHSSRKLSDNDVRTIRKVRAEGVPIQGIADAFGVSYSVIRSILIGETYVSVKGTKLQ